MASRREVGSWLEGSPSGPPGGSGDALGLPAEGRGSRAGLGRRVLALAVDWLLSTVVATAFIGEHPMLPLAVFALSTAVLVSTLGHTVGHRLLGLQVVRLADVARVPDRGRSRADRPAMPASWPPPGPVLGLTRTALLCLVLPAVVWDSAGRGLHDVAAGTVVVRR